MVTQGDGGKQGEPGEHALVERLLQVRQVIGGYVESREGRQRPHLPHRPPPAQPIVCQVQLLQAARRVRFTPSQASSLQ